MQAMTPKPDPFKEKRAPLDAYFSLGKAYMINNDLEKGLSTLETFRKLAKETEDKGGMKNLEFIDQQIKACKDAIDLRDKPLIFSKKILGDGFTQGAINENAAVSFDGNTIVYTERRGIVNAIFCSRKDKGHGSLLSILPRSSMPVMIALSCSLNSDGTELFLYKTDNYDGVIYSSSFIKMDHGHQSKNSTKI